MHIIILAFRNVIKGRQRSFLLSGTLAFSFSMVVLVNSFFTGIDTVQSQNQANIHGGHLSISGVELSESGKRINVISDAAKMRRALQPFEEDIAGYTIRNTQHVEFIVGASTQYAQVTGVAFAEEAIFLQQLDWVEGSLENVLLHDDSVILLESTAEKLHLHLGEILTLKARTITGQDTLASFTLQGIVRPKNPSLKSQFSAGYTHLNTMNTFVALPEGKYAQYMVRLHSAKEALRIHTSLSISLRASISMDKSQIDGLAFPMEADEHLIATYQFNDERYENIITWKGTDFRVRAMAFSLGGGFNYMVQLLALVVFIILLAITMVGIANSYHMIMLERQSEIAVMRAMGAQRSTIRILFRLEALCIAFIGILTGMVVVFATTTFLGMIPLPQTELWGYALLNGRLYLPLSLTMMAITAFFIIVAALVAVASASEKAAQLEPAIALNH